MNKQDAPARVEAKSERLGQLCDGLFARPGSAARARVSQIGRAIVQYSLTRIGDVAQAKLEEDDQGGRLVGSAGQIAPDWRHGSALARLTCASAAITAMMLAWS
jgi:hypothetical protein